MLDILAASLSGGRATHEISLDPLHETELSQVFIALDPSSLGGPDLSDVVKGVVDHLHRSAGEGDSPRYPGERTLDTRRRNLAEGIPVDAEIWKQVQGSLA